MHDIFLVMFISSLFMLSIKNKFKQIYDVKIQCKHKI
jgi:hypothetical protein